MKNILLSIVVISALVVAGVGGTFASFSDSETAVGNSAQAGTFDLVVRDTAGDFYNDPSVVSKILGPLKPCKSYDSHWTMKNLGNISGYAGLTIKNVTDIEDVVGALATSEPELVAEGGGKVDCTTVAGVGVDYNKMDKHVGVRIIVQGPDMASAVLQDLGSLIGVAPHMVGDVKWWKFSDIAGKEIDFTKTGLLGGGGVALATNEICTVEIDVHLQDISETEAYLEGLLPQTYFAPGTKWSDWPTNALQGDKIQFDIQFELLQTDCPAP